MPSFASPNSNERPAGARIDAVVLHYTGMPTAAEALARLTDPVAQVSAHYLLDEDGTVHALVGEGRRAWHAGLSAWGLCRDLNDMSIGIELANPGHAWGYRPFPEAQMGALVELLRGIVQRHGIVPERVLGHSDVAPGRKEDPGELFDWRRLACAGLAVQPSSGRAPVPLPMLSQALRLIGYPLDLQGVNVGLALTAFQRRFRPGRVDGIADEETLQLVAGMVTLRG